MRKVNAFVSFLAGLLLVVTSNVASADLILNVSDLGAGQTRWQFSGSTTALSASIQNAFWGQTWNAGTGDPVNNDNGFVFGIVSGSGSVTTTSFGTFGMNDIAMQDIGAGNQLISGRAGGAFSWSGGDTLSWIGDITVNQPFANLNPGTYTTNTILGTVISSNLVLTISAVPEPSSLAFFGLALVGLVAFRRRRK